MSGWRAGRAGRGSGVLAPPVSHRDPATCEETSLRDPLVLQEVTSLPPAVFGAIFGDGLRGLRRAERSDFLQGSPE